MSPGQPSDSQGTSTQEVAVQETDTQTPDSSTTESDHTDVGNGTFYIGSASGSTENGDEILVYPDMDSIPFAFVNYELWDMDGTVQTYIYLDGVEMEKEQVGVGVQASISLEEKSQVTEGKHTVTAVQYKGNDPEGEIVFYRSAEFTVKNQ